MSTGKVYLDRGKYDGATRAGGQQQKTAQPAPQAVQTKQPVSVDESMFKNLTKDEVELMTDVYESSDKEAGRFYWGNRDSFYINELVRKAVQEDREDFLAGRITEEEFNSRDDLRYLRAAKTTVDVRTGQTMPFNGAKYATQLENLEQKMHPLGVSAKLYRLGTYETKTVNGKQLPGYDQMLKKMGFDGTAKSLIGAQISFDNLTSTSYDSSRNHFTGRSDRNFIMHIMARPSTQVYAGTYHRGHESEIMLGRNQVGTVYNYREETVNGVKVRHLYILV